MRVLLLCLLFVIIRKSDNANILALFPYQGKSHFVMFEALVKELAERGHEVDVLSHFPRENKIPRYNDFSLKGSMPFLTNNATVEQMGNTIFDTVNLIQKTLGTELCKTILNVPATKKLRNSTKKYDVIITEIFGTDCMLGFSYIFKIPTIGMMSSVNLPWTSDRIGLPDNPSYIVNYYSPYLPGMSLIQRVWNTLYTIFFKNAYDMISMSESNVYAKEFFGEGLPDLSDLANNMSLMFVNSHFSIHQARPLVPNFIEVGGLHIRGNKSLTKYYENLLETKSKGVIYVSFGSMIQSELFPENTIRSFFEAFAELPYKVVWKANRAKFLKHIEVPNNIHFESWMPQLDVLCHPNVVLFVSHGGLMGTQEAIHCGVPILGVPIFADQELNIKATASKDLAVGVPYKTVTRSAILTAAKTLLEKPEYKLNAVKASKLFKDRPLSAMDTAVYWVEYVIRYQGAPHLRSAGADLKWYQYYLLDVGAILLGTILVVFFSIYYIISFIYIIYVYTQNLSKLKTN